jgi:hypothetical protein
MDQPWATPRDAATHDVCKPCKGEIVPLQGDDDLSLYVSPGRCPGLIHQEPFRLKRNVAPPAQRIAQHQDWRVGLVWRATVWQNGPRQPDNGLRRFFS